MDTTQESSASFETAGKRLMDDIAKTRARLQEMLKAGKTESASDLGLLLDDVEDLAKLVRGEERRLEHGLRERVDHLREALGEYGRSVAAHTRATVHKTESYVREEPWKSVGIAAALGVIIGFLLGRR